MKEFLLLVRTKEKLPCTFVNNNQLFLWKHSGLQLLEKVTTPLLFPKRQSWLHITDLHKLLGTKFPRQEQKPPFKQYLMAMSNLDAFALLMSKSKLLCKCRKGSLLLDLKQVQHQIKICLHLPYKSKVKKSETNLHFSSSVNAIPSKSLSP